MLEDNLDELFEGNFQTLSDSEQWTTVLTTIRNSYSWGQTEEMLIPFCFAECQDKENGHEVSSCNSGSIELVDTSQPGAEKVEKSTSEQNNKNCVNKELSEETKELN